MKPSFGRKPSPLDRRDYKLKAYAIEPTVTQRFWKVGATDQQGETPHCVGFGFAGWGNCLPVNDNYPKGEGHKIYYEAKVIDGQPHMENGSYVRSGAKAMLKRGRIQSYAFGSVDDARVHLLTKGPVVMGTNWTKGMLTPDANGTVHATGEIVGGHCWLAYGADKTYCYGQNSWGGSWGKGGLFRISWADLKKVYSHDGEACAAVEKPLPKLPPKPANSSVWDSILAALITLMNAGKRR